MAENECPVHRKETACSVLKTKEVGGMTGDPRVGLVVLQKVVKQSVTEVKMELTHKEAMQPWHLGPRDWAGATSVDECV
jgi:hypothetical protein